MITLRLGAFTGPPELQVLLPTPELQQRFAAMYDHGRLPELVDPDTFLDTVQGDYPTPPRTPWPQPKPGMIYWPVVGMAHYAFACLLVDEYTMGQIRAWQASSTVHRQLFVYLRDGVEDPDPDADEDTEDPTVVPLPMKVLASRPLVRTTDAALETDAESTTPQDAWVLLLVDNRYSALHCRSVLASAGTSPSSWSSLIGNAEAGAGEVTISVADAVDAAYLTPDAERWLCERSISRSTGWMADIAATSVGSRIVFTPTNSAPYQVGKLQRPTTTRRDALSDAHDAAVADGRFIGGGPITDVDIEVGRPKNVSVQFRGVNEGTSATSSVALSAPTMNDGASGSYMVTHWADPSVASTSSGDRTALAAKFAADWDAWQHGQHDTLYAGFVDVPESGFLWAVSYYHDSKIAYTRFHRAPLWYGFLTAPSYRASSLSGPADSVPTLDGAGGLQETPVFIDTTPVNGDPATKLTIYASQTITSSTPLIQFASLLDVDGTGTPAQLQLIYPAGTGGRPISQLQTLPSADVIQLQTGDESGTQGSIDLYTFSGFDVVLVDKRVTIGTNQILQVVIGSNGGFEFQQNVVLPANGVALIQVAGAAAGAVQLQVQANAAGKIDQLQEIFGLWNGSSVITKTVTTTAVGSNIVVTLPSGYTLDASAATLVGFGGGRAESTLTATGTDASTAAAITTEAVVVSGADGTVGVILPNSAGGLIAVYNAAIPSGLNVYPPAGATFDFAASSDIVASRTGKLYCRVSPTVWIGR